MARGKREQTKVRVIAVYRIMTRGRKVTAKQVVDELKNVYGIRADRKTIMADMLAVDRFIPLESKGGFGGGYWTVDVVGGCKDA